MRWNTIKYVDDLKLLPKNYLNKRYSKKILVSSTKHCSINQVFLMYFDFEDQMFHFPSYSPNFSDVKLKPIEEINKWVELPKEPRMKKPCC